MPWKASAKVFAGLALLLIMIGQLYYLPLRLDTLRHLLRLARSQPQEIASLAYGAASYELLVWLEQHVAPETTLLLLTASPRAYGDPAYVLYHRAMYHLYPRQIWWAAPVPPRQVPTWWLPTDLAPAHILTLAQTYQAAAILAEGFVHPPVPGSVLSFDQNTYLIFLTSSGSKLRVEAGGSGVQVQTARGFWPGVANLFLTLGAIFSIWAWGDWLVGGRGKLGRIGSLGPRLGVGWLLGCGITSLTTFLLLWAGGSLQTSVMGLSLLGMLLWLQAHYHDYPRLNPAALRSHFWLSFRHFPVAARPLDLLFTLILAVQIGLVVFAAWASPLADWDAWVNWAGKANILFLEQTLSPDIYHNPARLPTNLDYPLLLPLVEAWFYTWLGQIHEPAINWISVLFYGALLLLFYHACRRFAPPTAALGFTTLLATIPRLERPAASGLADIPLAALVFLTFFLLVQSFDNKRALLRLAFAAGLLPWLKNEGWLWWGLISLALLLRLGWQVKRQQHPTGDAFFVFLVYYLLPALAIPLLWQLFLTVYGTYRFTFLPLTLTTFWTNLPRLLSIVWHMLARLFNPYWNFVWLFVVLALVSRRQRIFSAPAGWLILPGLAYLGLVTLSYVFSRFEPFLAHLNNSAERLILQATPLALWWLLGQSVALGWVSRHKER